MVENPKTEGEDFFGVERAVQIPPPGIAATPQSSEDQSGTEFIEAQYFDSLQAKEDSASSVCTEGELSFVDEQYFRKNLQTKIVRKDVPQSAENSTADRNEASDKKAATHSLEHYLKPSLHECDAEEKQVSRGTQKRMQKQPVVISQPKAAVGEDEEDRYGIEAILQRIEPVWKMSEEQLTELMCSRVIYDDENLIAFDKPYQMAYSGAPRDQAQLDRILQAIKATVAPKIERLCLIRSLDKDLSGIILFAKNKLVQTEIREKYKNGLVEQRYRTIVSRVPDNKEAIINIPLIKKMTKRNFLMRPLLPGAIGDAFHVNTEYKIINDNGSCALLQCTVKNDVTHQIRSHLGFGLGCPVIGDTKYSGPGEYLPPKLSPQAKQLLGLSGNQYRKLPLYLHLNEVCIPKGGIHSSQIYVKAPIPEFFRYTLKKLKLLKK